MSKRRLDQLLSAQGYCSRREVQGLCDEGRVKVGEREADDASERVEPSQVTVDGEPLEFPDALFVMVNKPVGYVCSHDDREGKRVYDLLPPRWLVREPKVVTIGRLDKDTSGVLLMTDVGPLVQRLTSPKHHVDKVYVAQLDGPVTDELVARFASGALQLEGDDAPCLPAQVVSRGPTTAEVTMREGRYHQVRRMFAACGRHVHALHRERFGQWTLEGLAEGEYRALQLP